LTWIKFGEIPYHGNKGGKGAEEDNGPKKIVRCEGEENGSYCPPENSVLFRNEPGMGLGETKRSAFEQEAE